MLPINPISPLYLDQATVSISACALLYNSSLFARALRRSMIAGSSFNNADNRFGYKNFPKINQTDHQFYQKSRYEKMVRENHSYLQFTQFSVEEVEQASFSFTDLTINDGLWNGVAQSCADHINIRQYGCSCSFIVREPMIRNKIH